MKKIVLTFGLIAGGILSIMMTGNVLFVESIGFDKGEIIGYTSMVLSFLLVFFGIRAYRNSSGGLVTFGKAFTVGILITAIACICYVVTWEIVYFYFTPDFLDKYSAYTIAHMKSSGTAPSAIEAQVQQMDKLKELYRNPLFNVAMTFMEPFPVGLIMTLISSAILRKGKPN